MTLAFRLPQSAFRFLSSAFETSGSTSGGRAFYRQDEEVQWQGGFKAERRSVTGFALSLRGSGSVSLSFRTAIGLLTPKAGCKPALRQKLATAARASSRIIRHVLFILALRVSHRSSSARPSLRLDRCGHFAPFFSLTDLGAEPNGTQSSRS